MVLKTHNTQAEVSFPGITLYLDIQVDYRVDTSQRGKPRVDGLAAMRVKINGQYQGVDELTIALRDKGFAEQMLEEIQSRETENAEYGDDPLVGTRCR